MSQSTASRPIKISLKDQLALLEDPTPIDFDPEALENEYPDSENDAGEEAGSMADKAVGEVKLAREHYIAVGKGKLRKGAPHVLDPKYDGERVSRKRLFNDESEGEEEYGEEDVASEIEPESKPRGKITNEPKHPHLETEEEEEEEEEEGEQEGIEGESGDIKFANLDESDETDEDEDINSDEAFGESDIENDKFKEFRFRGSSTTVGGVVPKNGNKVVGSSNDSGGDEEDMEMDGEMSDEESDNGGEGEDEGKETDEEGRRKEAACREELRKIMTEEQKLVTAKVTQDAKTDVQKGQAVRRQQLTFDSLLGARIKLQKAIIGSNALNPGVYAAEHESKQASFKAAEEAAVKLWNLITDMRTNLLELRKSPMQSNCHGNGLKRKEPYEADLDTPLSTLWSDMTSLELENSASRTTTLSKWSQKVNSSASSLILNSKKLNTTAMSQNNVINIINELLTNDLERQIKKTKVSRSCVASAPQKVTKEDIDPEIFDDTDLYSTLLKTLIDSRMVDSTNPNLASQGSAVRWTTALQESKIASKIKKNVDTKASKGRKLRYHVHERLVSFMVAEKGVLKWENRQVDELFGSLLGMRGLRTIDEEESQGEGKSGDSDEEIEIPEDGLKIFG